MPAIPLGYHVQSDSSWPTLIRIAAVAMIVYACEPLLSLASWLWLFLRQIFGVTKSTRATPTISGTDLLFALPVSVLAVIVLVGAIGVLRHRPWGRKTLTRGIAIYVGGSILFFLIYDPWFFFVRLRGNDAIWVMSQLTNALLRTFESWVLPVVAWLILRLPEARRTMDAQAHASGENNR